MTEHNMKQIFVLLHTREQSLLALCQADPTDALNIGKLNGLNQVRHEIFGAKDIERSLRIATDVYTGATTRRRKCVNGITREWSDSERIRHYGRTFSEERKKAHWLSMMRKSLVNVFYKVIKVEELPFEELLTLYDSYWQGYRESVDWVSGLLAQVIEEG